MAQIKLTFIWIWLNRCFRYVSPGFLSQEESIDPIRGKDMKSISNAIRQLYVCKKFTLPTILPVIPYTFCKNKLSVTRYLNAYDPDLSYFPPSKFPQALRSLIQAFFSLLSICLLFPPLASSSLSHSRWVWRREKSPNSFEFFVHAVLPVLQLALKEGLTNKNN